MITKEQALTAQEFHEGECLCNVGPRGGKTITQKIWRRNGQTETWKTRPNEFSVPVKYGLKECGSITQSYAALFHTRDDCPLNQ